MVKIAFKTGCIKKNTLKKSKSKFFLVLGVNLHEAAEKGLLQTVEYLVGEGASVDEKDEYGMYFNRINSLFVLC